MRVERKLTAKERAEVEAIAEKFKAGTVTEEELRRAFILEGYKEEWAAYLAKIGGFPKE